jgi:hypothetical protein
VIQLTPAPDGAGVVQLRCRSLTCSCPKSYAAHAHPRAERCAVSPLHFRWNCVTEAVGNRSRRSCIRLQPAAVAKFHFYHALTPTTCAGSHHERGQLLKRP